MFLTRLQIEKIEKAKMDIEFSKRDLYLLSFLSL